MNSISDCKVDSERRQEVHRIRLSTVRGNMWQSKRKEKS